MEEKGDFLIPGMIYGLSIALGILLIWSTFTNPAKSVDEAISANFIYAIIGSIPVIWAYIARKEAAYVYVGHCTFIIRTFWIGLLYTTVFTVLFAILLPELYSPSYADEASFFKSLLFLIFVALHLAIIVWYYVRYFRGLTSYLRGQPIKNPLTWGL